jgi:hypothetical protein
MSEPVDVGHILTAVSMGAFCAFFSVHDERIREYAVGFVFPSVIAPPPKGLSTGVRTRVRFQVQFAFRPGQADKLFRN